MDMWGFVEAQETVSVSPAMYGEFVFPYHRELAERFGLNYYGCCEPYETRWQYVKQLPRLRRVSVCPWSDVATVPELLGCSMHQIESIAAGAVQYERGLCARAMPVRCAKIPGRNL